MKVSVLIPLYKTNESHLREAIDSVLKQTFRDFELLLLDDSPEGEDVSAIVSAYDDPRIRYIRNPKNLGISASRNKLIDMAKGEYLATMDHDDISLPERLEKQVNYLDAHPEVGVVGCWVRELPSRRVSAWMTDDDSIRLGLMYGCVVPHSASMMRKSVLVRNGVRYESRFSPAEDYALWCRLLSYTAFANLSEVLFEYRLHENSASRVQADRMNRARLAVQGWVRTEHPDLYATYCLRAEHKMVFRLFNILPVFSLVTSGNHTTLKLFECIPVLTWKEVRKIR